MYNLHTNKVNTLQKNSMGRDEERQFEYFVGRLVRRTQTYSVDARYFQHLKSG